MCMEVMNICVCVCEKGAVAGSVFIVQKKYYRIDLLAFLHFYKRDNLESSVFRLVSEVFLLL